MSLLQTFFFRQVDWSISRAEINIIPNELLELPNLHHASIIRIVEWTKVIILRFDERRVLEYSSLLDIIILSI